MSMKGEQGGQSSKQRNLPLDLPLVPLFQPLSTIQFFHFQDNCRRKRAIGHWKKRSSEVRKEKHIGKERKKVVSVVSLRRSAHVASRPA